uniref:Uncharacterized protein n=1 Tax=Tanacetum cinerariifolium TaxID=118510 RepID=A0A699KXF4_TANCI|nr:hypothetical protein [Tanacetum cinerariifolium]
MDDAYYCMEKRNDLDTMSLDDLYNHLKVYEAKVQKKTNLNSQDMAFISSLKNSSNEDGNTPCVTTASTAFPTGSVNVSTQKSERGRKESYRQGYKAKEKSSKALMAIDGVVWDWSYMANEEDHALVADRKAPTEFALMANTESKEVKLEKDGLDEKLAGLLKASKNLDHLIESQKSDQVKEGVGYNVVPPPAADLYLSPKKDLSWTGLPEFVDDIVTDYSRPSPTVKKKMMKKSSSSENEPCCSKDCKKNTESLNTKIDELKNELYEANIYRHRYKLGIDQLEGRLAEYKEREVKYIEKIRTLEMNKEYNLGKINKLTNEVETLKEKKDVVDGKLAHLRKSSKDLKDIIES